MPPPITTRSRAQVNPLPSTSSSNPEVTSSNLENNRVGAVRVGEGERSYELPSFGQGSGSDNTSYPSQVENNSLGLAGIGSQYIAGTFRYWGTELNPILKWLKPVTPEEFDPVGSESESVSGKTTEFEEDSNSRVQTVGRLQPLSSALQKSLERTVAKRVLIARKMVKSESDMPMPFTRDAPQFRGPQDARQLPRFLETVTELLKNCNVTDDARKKTWLGRYADAETELEWKGMETYEAGKTFEEHKKSILSSYWETKDLEEGSIAKLDKLVKKNQGLTLNDQSEVFDFIRQFRALIKPLVREQVITNRELVEKFLDALAQSFRTALEVKLGTAREWRENLEAQNRRLEWLESQAAGQAGAQPPPVAAQPTKRKIEDLYKIEEVLNEAVEMLELRVRGTAIADSDAGKASEFSRSKTPVKDNAKVRFKSEEIESQIESLAAFMKDHMVNQEKRDKQTREELRSMNEWIRMQAQQPSSGQAMRRSDYSNNNSRSYNQTSAPSRDNCFYCGESGHMQTECGHRQRHLREGLIIAEGGGFRMPNGYWFPKLQPGEVKTPRERVEEYYANKKKESANSYEMYDFLGNDREDNQDPTYSTYSVLSKGRVREESVPISQVSWEEFQEYRAFMKAKADLQNDTSGVGSSSSF